MFLHFITGFLFASMIFGQFVAIDLFVYDLGVVSLAVAGILILGGTGLGITFQIVLQRMFDDELVTYERPGLFRAFFCLGKTCCSSYLTLLITLWMIVTKQHCVPRFVCLAPHDSFNAALCLLLKYSSVSL